MELKEGVKHLSKNIKELEKQIYNFENVSIPRYQQDKVILAKLRTDLIKMDAMKQKQERGEEISSEEWVDAVPGMWRGEK